MACVCIINSPPMHVALRSFKDHVALAMMISVARVHQACIAAVHVSRQVVNVPVLCR